MKCNQFITLIIFCILFNFSVSAETLSATTGNHIRIWRGYKLANFSFQDFLSQLSINFLPETARVPGKFGLQTYIVAIPPKIDYLSIPDEIAFLVYSSKKAYKSMYSTEEGRQYGASHWNVFDRKTSNTRVPIPFVPTSLSDATKGVAYDMIGRPVNWDMGHTSISIGLRRSCLRPEEFIARMHWHLSSTRAILSRSGLQGYLVLLSTDYEIAIMNWQHEKSMKHAFTSVSGKKIIKYRTKLMNTIMWKSPKPFKPSLIRGALVKVVIQY